MKILITTDLFTTQTNGVVTSVNNLWDELNRQGHSVRILTVSENRHSYTCGTVSYIRSIPIGVYPGVRMPTSYRHKLIREIIAWKPDIIHSQCEFFSFQFAKYISRKTGAPIIHTFHTLYEQYVSYLIPFKRLGYRLLPQLCRTRLRCTERIIVPTDKVKAVLQSYWVEKPISVLPSGIDLEQHKQQMPPSQRAQKRQALGIKSDQLVMINLGRLGTEKNTDELIRYFAIARKRHGNLLFLIVGDGPAKTQLESLAQVLGISEYVIFTGMVKPSQVHEYYQLGDVFVCASTSETQGLTYTEAAANGLPLLCRRDECLHNVIRQGANGYEYATESDFLAYLEQIISDPVWREAAGRQSRSIAATFDKRCFGQAVETQYKEVLDYISKRTSHQGG